MSLFPSVYRSHMFVSSCCVFFFCWCDLEAADWRITDSDCVGWKHFDFREVQVDSGCRRSVWSTGGHQDQESSSADVRLWETSRTNQDFTFRDHFFSCWLEECVSKEFGLAAHDEELRCFLQSRKLVEDFVSPPLLKIVQSFWLKLWWRKHDLSGAFYTV